MSKNKKQNSKPPPSKNWIYKLKKILDGLHISLMELSKIFSKDMFKIAYSLTVLVFIGQMLLMGVGLVDFEFNKIGLTALLILFLKN